MRVLVLGGAGNFGARIVRALAPFAIIEVVAASRRALKVPGAEHVRVVTLDMESPRFAAQLAAQSPGLVIHCVGPYQGQDYRVAETALAAGAHYLDLADGRAFVCGFGPAMDAAARKAERVALTGVSTLPALSSAVVDSLRNGMASLSSIDVVIAPGQRATRGVATLAAVFSYLGRSFPVWQDGRWLPAWGWMGLQRADLAIGRRLSAWCDVPDLGLFPTHYTGVRSVQFKAALEFRPQHLSLWVMAALRRTGVALPVERWAGAIDRAASVWDAFAGHLGGMRVRVVGQDGAGHVIKREWQVIADAVRGPEIPCMAAIVLARKMAQGQAPRAGARACLSELTLEDFAPEFERWGMRTQLGTFT